MYEKPIKVINVSSSVWTKTEIKIIVLATAAAASQRMSVSGVGKIEKIDSIMKL